MQKQCKIHPKTLQKINKQIINNNNNNNNNSNNINNGIIINNIVKFGARGPKRSSHPCGSERLSEILTEAEMMKITKYINLSVNESIKMVHFNNKRPQYKNIRIKNLKDVYLLFFLLKK